MALGTGLFKPNISAMVGGLYRQGDERRDAGFSIFYMGINIGGFIAPLVTGFLAQSALFKSWLSAWGFDPALSWHWGFGAAGVGMTLGLIVYHLRRRRLATWGARPPCRAATWGASLLVVAGTGAVMALTDAVGRRPIGCARCSCWCPLPPSSGSRRAATSIPSASPPCSSFSSPP